MTILASYILGILTVFLLGIAVGMFVVVRRTQSLQRDIDNINLELNNASGDIYRLVESERKEIDGTITELYRELEKHNDDIHRTMDSRLNKLENKLIPSDSVKPLLKG
jgi:uncharacterized membrane protein